MVITRVRKSLQKKVVKKYRYQERHTEVLPILRCGSDYIKKMYKNCLETQQSYRFWASVHSSTATIVWNNVSNEQYVWARVRCKYEWVSAITVHWGIHEVRVKQVWGIVWVALPVALWGMWLSLVTHESYVIVCVCLCADSLCRASSIQ